MQLFKSICHCAARLWKRLYQICKKRKVLYTASHVVDFPDVPKEKIVYLLGAENREWLAGFICPCGCGEFIELVLTGNTHPVWKLSVEANRSVTLLPSVWRNVGCRSHFFLRSGLVKWC